jgi:ethanolamine utilization protein EutQ (cupin superfamily)
MDNIKVEKVIKQESSDKFVINKTEACKSQSGVDVVDMSFIETKAEYDQANPTQDLQKLMSNIRTYNDTKQSEVQNNKDASFPGK